MNQTDYTTTLQPRTLPAHLQLGLLAQHPLQNLTGRVFRNRIDKPHPTLQSLISRQLFRREAFDILLGHTLAGRGRVAHDVGARNFAGGVAGDADYGDVFDGWVRDQDTLEFGGCDLEAANFDEFLFAVDDVPFARAAVAAADVAGVEVAG